MIYSNIVGVAGAEAGAEACKAEVGDLGVERGGEEDLVFIQDLHQFILNQNLKHQLILFGHCPHRHLI